MTLCSRILKALLNELVERSVIGKHPKLMLRRYVANSRRAEFVFCFCFSLTYHSINHFHYQSIFILLLSQLTFFLLARLIVTIIIDY